MTRPTVRSFAVPLLVLMVVLAGCSGGGGGDGGDGDDAGTTAMETTAMETTTAPSAGDGGDGGDATTTTTTDASDGGDGTADGVDPAEHAEALQAAGSYTLAFTITGISGQSGTFSGVQMVDLDSGERFSRLETTSGDTTFTAEYYQPSATGQAYQQVSGQVREVPSGQAFFLEYSEPGTGIGAGEYSGFERAGSVQTDLGPGTRYVIDSVEDLPDAETEVYDTLEDVRFEVVVDDDTGLLVSYHYEVDYVQDGQSGTVSIDFQLQDVGSTTVERPDWVPDN